MCDTLISEVILDVFFIWIYPFASSYEVSQIRFLVFVDSVKFLVPTLVCCTMVLFPTMSTLKANPM